MDGEANRVVELAFVSDEECECVFTDPNGGEFRVPAFWSGGNEWRVRYASPIVGEHRFVGPGLRGAVEIRPYGGKNLLYKHGPLRISPDGPRFQHLDGQEFFWLGDTWWFGLVDRLSWPDEFRRLTADRVEKGFSIIQIIAGLYGELPPFDPRGGSDWPWEDGFTCLNTGWWDKADLKLAWLVNSGLVPCIVGAWGYYLRFAGLEAMRTHWRNIIARYGAYPVVWCLAGETRLPYYDDMFSERSASITEELGAGWAELARYIRDTDPFGRILTTHPSPGDGSWSSREVFPADPSLYDVNMLQTGHWDRQSYEKTLDVLRTEVAETPDKPVLNGEVCYEGIMGSNWQETQRFIFWSQMLSGAAGHTYGAQGLWAMSDGTFAGEPGSWSGTTWEEAMDFPGSTQVGIGRRILERYAWWEFEVHPEWIQAPASEDAIVLAHTEAEGGSTQRDPLLAYAAGTSDVRVIYFPSAMLPSSLRALRLLKIVGMQPGSRWRGQHVDPRRGLWLPEWHVVASDAGDAVLEGGLLTWNPTMEDWLVVLERET